MSLIELGSVKASSSNADANPNASVESTHPQSDNSSSARHMYHFEHETKLYRLGSRAVPGMYRSLPYTFLPADYYTIQREVPLAVKNLSRILFSHNWPATGYRFPRRSFCAALSIHGNGHNLYFHSAIVFETI
jgi:hypothetical protein